jgi:hypothetical protein
MTAGAPLAASDPVGFLFTQPSGDLTQHIFYISDMLDIIELTDGSPFE